MSEVKPLPKTPYYKPFPGINKNPPKSARYRLNGWYVLASTPAFLRVPASHKKYSKAPGTKKYNR